MPERQRKLHSERKQREPRTTPDIRPNPLHAEIAPHIRQHIRAEGCYNITYIAGVAGVNLPKLVFGDLVIFMPRSRERTAFSSPPA